MAVLADERAVEEVAGIDLHSRLGRQHFEHASACGILEPRGELGFRRQPRVEREIMVVAAPDHDLRVGAVADAVADDAAVAEIEYAAVDRLKLPGRDQRRATGRAWCRERVGQYG